MHARVYTRPTADQSASDTHSPLRRAQRLSRLYDDLTAKFGFQYPLAVRVKAQRDAARALAGPDGEVTS
jgi:hypothetical protein